MEEDTKIAALAAVCHNANRTWAMASGEDPSTIWPEFHQAPFEIRSSAYDGVTAALAGATPRNLHESWCIGKVAAGWVYGPVRDNAKKIHPCLVDYDALPESQRKKDALFHSIVHALKVLVLVGVTVTLAACNQLIKGNPLAVNADPNPSAAKCQTDPAKCGGTVVKQESTAPIQGKICDEGGGGLESDTTSRLTATLTNRNTDCTWDALFVAYGVPPVDGRPAEDPASQHWMAGLEKVIPPGQSRSFDIAYSACRTNDTIALQTDIWALREHLQPTDTPLPKQFRQQSIPLHEFGGKSWPVDECEGTPTPPQDPPPPPQPPQHPPTPPDPPPPPPPCIGGSSAAFSGLEIAQFPDGFPEDQKWLPLFRTLPVMVPVGEWDLYATTHHKPDVHQGAEIGGLRFEDGYDSGEIGPTEDVGDNEATHRTFLGHIRLDRPTISVTLFHMGPPHVSEPTNSFDLQLIEWVCPTPSTVRASRPIRR